MQNTQRKGEGMAQFKVYLDRENYEQLVEIATRECRPPDFQVEWFVRQGIKAATQHKPKRAKAAMMTGVERAAQVDEP
jgi:hypothetical protein